MERTKKINSNSIVMQTIKGSLIAVIVSLIGILFFAFFIKLMGISDNLIKPINQIIKVISIMIGVFIVNKNSNEKGLLKGAIIGLIYTVIAFLVFSALNGTFTFDKTLLNDVLFATITGAICGVIFINLKKRTK